MKTYHTEQRKLLQDFFEQNAGTKFSVDEIVQHFSNTEKISLSAVYRNIDKMAQEGLLVKTISTESNKALYQFIKCAKGCERIHLKCERCGKVMHLENKDAESKLSLMLEKNGFTLDQHESVLVGLCKDCK